MNYEKKNRSEFNLLVDSENENKSNNSFSLFNGNDFLSFFPFLFIKKQYDPFKYEIHCYLKT